MSKEMNVGPGIGPIVHKCIPGIGSVVINNGPGSDPLVPQCGPKDPEPGWGKLRKYKSQWEYGEVRPAKEYIKHKEERLCILES